MVRRVQSWIFDKKGKVDWYLNSLLGHSEYDLYDKRDLQMVLYAAKKTGGVVVKGKSAPSDLAVVYFHEEVCYRAHKRDAFLVSVYMLHLYILNRVGLIYFFATTISFYGCN